jgi:hypothetical protein
MGIDETTLKMSRRSAPIRSPVQTTKLADLRLSKTGNSRKTMGTPMNVAQVQTMRFKEVGVFLRSIAAGNTWWTTGVATALAHRPVATIGFKRVAIMFWLQSQPE